MSQLLETGALQIAAEVRANPIQKEAIGHADGQRAAFELKPSARAEP